METVAARIPFFSLLFLCFQVLFVTSGCERESQPGRAEVKEVRVVDTLLTLSVGERRLLEIMALDSVRNEVLDFDLSLSSADSALVKPDSLGGVTALAPGGTTVTVSLGSASTSVRIDVLDDLDDSQIGELPPKTVIVDPDHPSWLSYAGGDPLFFCGPGDPEGFLYRGTRAEDGTRVGDQSALIAKLGPTGANTLYVQAIRSHGGDGEGDENPFVDGDPAKGLSTAVLNQWDGWLSALEAQGVVVFLFFYDDGSSVWDTGDVVGPSERTFVQALVDRFEHHGNLIWVIAEEYAEAFSEKRISDLASVVRLADDFRHPIAVHQNSSLVFAFPDDPHIDQFAMQFNPRLTPDLLHESLAEAFEKAQGRFNLTLAEREGHGLEEEDEIRQLNWAAAMAGAYVLVYQWEVDSTPERQLQQCGYLVEFLEAADVRGSRPQSDLARGDTRFLLAGPGDRYIGYTRRFAQEVGISGVASGAWSLRWMDVESGARRSETINLNSGEDFSVSPPPDLGGELAFVLSRRPEG